jgi:hypothetical protein
VDYFNVTGENVPACTQLSVLGPKCDDVCHNIETLHRSNTECLN